VVGDLARWLRDEEAAGHSAGHARARCNYDRRALTVNHGAADVLTSSYVPTGRARETSTDFPSW